MEMIAVKNLFKRVLCLLLVLVLTGSMLPTVFATGSGDESTVLTDEDYAFWLEVKQTYDRINGRAKKYYTEKQILAWYNKLHNDGAEYKMWGNGIALPCALYVMQGIAQVMADKQPK